MFFPKDNKIVFFQDHAWYEGIPSDIDFEMEIKVGGTVYLKGPGYGEKGNYGNGILILSFSGWDGLDAWARKDMETEKVKAIRGIVKSKIIEAIKKI